MKDFILFIIVWVITMTFILGGNEIYIRIKEKKEKKKKVLWYLNNIFGEKRAKLISSKKLEEIKI